MFLFIVGHEVVNFNNVVDGSASPNVPPVNLASLAPQPQDELQLPESARSTVSARSWLTDDKWSDEDDDDEIASAATATAFMPKAAASKEAPPVGMLGSYTASGSALQGVKRSAFSCVCDV